MTVLAEPSMQPWDLVLRVERCADACLVQPAVQLVPECGVAVGDGGCELAGSGRVTTAQGFVCRCRGCGPLADDDHSCLVRGCNWHDVHHLRRTLAWDRRLQDGAAGREVGVAIVVIVDGLELSSQGVGAVCHVL